MDKTDKAIIHKGDAVGVGAAIEKGDAADGLGFQEELLPSEGTVCSAATATTAVMVLNPPFVSNRNRFKTSMRVNANTFRRFTWRKYEI